MTKEDFEKLVDYVSKEGLQVPRKVLETGGKGYDDWRSRANLGRWLCNWRYKKYESGIELLKSVADAEAVDFEDIENKAWAMQTLGINVWNLEKNADEALKYINIAIELAEGTKGAFSFINRGELWGNRWFFLMAKGMEEEALQEIEEKIRLSSDSTYECNSYLYQAYRLKAKIQYKNGNVEEAFVFLKKAGDCCKIEKCENCREKFADIWEKRGDNLNESYEKLEKLLDEHSQTGHVCWDEWEEIIAE